MNISDKIQNSFHKKLLVFIVLFILVLVIIILLPLKFSNYITTAGKILPAKSWIVSKGNSGQLISFLHDMEKGIINNYSVKEFERGDNIQLNFIPDFGIGKFINVEDTVGYIYSNEIEKQISELKTELGITKSSLEVNLTGEKESVIKEAEENLKYQIRQAKEQKKILARQKGMYDKNLISREEYELTLNQSELYDIAVDIAEARLESVTSGAKEEQIELLRNQIKSLQNQIDVLEKRNSSYNLVSPISGVVSNIATGDTLFTVVEKNRYVVVMPVKLKDMQYINSSSEVLVSLPLISKILSGKIHFIDNSALPLSSGQAIWAVASFSSEEQITNGVIVECKIEGGSLDAYSHLKNLMDQNIF